MFRAVLALGPVIGCDFKSTEIDLTPSAWSKHLDLYKHRALPTKQFPPHPHPTPHVYRLFWFALRLSPVCFPSQRRLFNVRASFS